MDKKTIQALRQDINRGLEQIAAKYGLQELKAGNATYSPNGGNFKFTLEGVVRGGLTKEQERYNTWVKLYDMPTLGTEVEIRGKVYKIVGINTYNPGSRYCKVLATRDGKTYAIPFDEVREKYGKPLPPKEGFLTLVDLD